MFTDQKVISLKMQQPDMSSVESGETQAALEQFWPKVTEEIRTMSITDLKRQELPLARIKKIMKLDEVRLR